jgi:hypothetical protein
VIIQCCAVEMYNEVKKDWRVMSSWQLGKNPELMAAIDQDRLGARGWPIDRSECASDLDEIVHSVKTFTVSELPLYFEQYGIAYGSLLSSLRCLVDRKIRVLTYRIEE